MKRNDPFVVVVLLGLAFVTRCAEAQLPTAWRLASTPSSWRFEHRVLQDYFADRDAMNGECAIVDIDGDGHPDLWWSCYAFVTNKAAYQRQKDLYQMAWYQGPDFRQMFRMHKGVTHGGNWCDVNGDGRMTW